MTAKDDRIREAMRLAREGDPDWRDGMPWGWRASRWWWIHREAVYVLIALLTAIAGLLFLSACTYPAPPPAHTMPVVSRQSPSAMASDYGPILDEIPWCDDPHGNSTAGVWPCQWDRRESAAPSWDPTVPQVAIFVRAADGCPEAIDTSNQAWACYWRPQDQAGVTP